MLPYSDDVARAWGQISVYAIRRRLRPAKDSWIAACALTYGLPLAGNSEMAASSALS